MNSRGEAGKSLFVEGLNEEGKCINFPRLLRCHTSYPTRFMLCEYIKIKGQVMIGKIAPCLLIKDISDQRLKEEVEWKRACEEPGRDIVFDLM